MFYHNLGGFTNRTPSAKYMSKLSKVRSYPSNRYKNHFEGSRNKAKMKNGF